MRPITLLLIYVMSLANAALATVDTAKWDAALQSWAQQLPQNPSGAVNALQEWIAHPDTNRFPALTGQTHLLMGNSHYYRGRTASAVQHIQRAVYWFEKAKDTLLLGKGYNNLGAIYRLQGVYDSALVLYEKAATLKKQQRDWQGMIRTLTNMGNVYNQRGYPLTATNYYLEALHLSDSLMEVQSAATLRLNLGILAKEQYRQEDALRYYRSALQQFRDLADPIGIATVLTNMSSIWLEREQPDSAQLLLEQALEKAAAAGDAIGEGYALINLGQVHLLKGQPQIALGPLDRSLEIFTAVEDRAALVEAQYFLGETHRQLGNLMQAQLYLERAIDQIEEMGSERKHLQAYRYYWQLLRDLADWQTAASISDSLMLWQEERFAAQQSRLVADLQTRYALKDKEKQLQASQYAVEKLSQQQEIAHLRQWLLVAGIAFLLLISGGIIWWLYKRQQQRMVVMQMTQLRLENTQLRNRKLQDEMEIKDQLLTKYALHISEKNRFLADVLKQMKTTAGVKEARSRMRQYLHSARELEDYYEESNRILADFRSELQQKFPQLTERDLRLCALLKQGLTSKEIAGMLNISDKSVDIARYRLRKKMNVPKSMGLDAFLQDLP